MMLIPWISTPQVHPGLRPELRRPSNRKIVAIHKHCTDSDVERCSSPAINGTCQNVNVWGNRECMERQLSKNCSKFCGLTGPTSDSMPGKCPAKTPECRVDQNGSMASSRPRRSTKQGCDCDNVRVIRSSRWGRDIEGATSLVL